MRTQVLVIQVGVTHVGGPQVGGHERLDHRRHHADGDVAPYPGLAPVEHRAQVQEVLQHPKAGLDVGELAIGQDHLGGVGSLGAAAGGEHVATAEELFVVQGVLAVAEQRLEDREFDAFKHGEHRDVTRFSPWRYVEKREFLGTGPPSAHRGRPRIHASERS